MWKSNKKYATLFHSEVNTLKNLTPQSLGTMEK